MPNWVYNNMNVNGTAKDLIAFRDKASKIAPSGISEDGVLEYKDENASPLSFWNFIEPENKPRYFGASDYKPDGYAEMSMEDRMAIAMKHESDGWYDWNVSNWGVKWDAGSVNLTDMTDDKAAYLGYSFETAWGIPEQVFTAIVRQHPELSFDFSCEEEQGWGAEFTSSDADDVDENGVPTKSLIMTREWDIPSSHADYDALGRDCWACENGDEEDFYEDCPRQETDFVVVVERRYIVRATSAEGAWEVAQDKLDELTAEDSDSFWVVDENTGQKLFPTLDEESEA
jgi:hypothetical protein